MEIDRGVTRVGTNGHEEGEPNRHNMDKGSVREGWTGDVGVPKDGSKLRQRS
ncbi:MAG TPA: hypothetical protein VK633_10245 [Verrucomicrobiae bacterium]|nr:hypothetical protein [Verrucomicrobiae bacterium]